MRYRKAFTAVVLAGAALAGAATAAPTVDIAIGKSLQTKTRTYGARELSYLTQDLRRSLEGMVRRKADPALENARFDLVIADAKPNRPTFEQLTATPGLSMQSIAIGGAALEGTVTYSDGRVVPVKYSWYDPDIISAIGSTTWTGANRAFDLFAYKVARDGALTTR